MSQPAEWEKQYATEKGSRESVSGYGSTLENTLELRLALPDIFRKYNITSVVDVPCGDWNWMSQVPLTGIYYTGCDIVPRLIHDNIVVYGQRNIAFKLLDITKEVPPGSDLVLCRDLLFHLSNEDIKAALNNIWASGCKYLMTTSFPNVLNTDIQYGGSINWRKIDVCGSPFKLSDPEYIVQENSSHACQNRIVGLIRRKL